MRTNDKANWERRLAGDKDVPTHPDIPDYGFYRIRSRDKQTWHIIAYWYTDDGVLRCRKDGYDIGETAACQHWPFASANPITHELYAAVLAGAPWPDLNEAVTLSNKAPPDGSFEALSERIADLVREATKITEVKTQDEADQAADLANKLGELQTKADERRAEEKRPHDEKAREVQLLWKPIVDAADGAKRKVKSIIARFLAAKEEADRKAREDAIKAGAPEPEPQARGSTTKAGTRGRAVALRTVKDVTITDRAAVLAYFAEGQAMTDFLQTQAQAALRAGLSVPGITITERKVAA